MKVDLIANMKSTAEFTAAYQPGDEGRDFEGKSLIFFSLGNPSLADRAAISDYLLDRGVPVAGVSPDGNGVLHVLLGQVQHDILDTTALSARLLGSGADINLLDAKNRLPIQSLLAIKAIDDELAPLYDLWFSHDDLDLTTKNEWGLSPLDLAKKVPYRAAAVARMERYLRDH